MFCWDTLGLHIHVDATWPVQTLFGVIWCLLFKFYPWRRHLPTHWTQNNKHSSARHQRTTQEVLWPCTDRSELFCLHKKNLHHIKQVGFNTVYDYNIFSLANTVESIVGFSLYISAHWDTI